MKRKITGILAIVLGISLIGSITAYAALEKAPSYVEVPKDSIRSGAVKQKTFLTGDKEKMKLTYVKTDYAGVTKYQDCYTDENDTEYYFNEKGDFVCLFPSFEVSMEKIEEQQIQNSVGEAEALELADRALKEILGDEATELGEGRLSIDNQLTYYFEYSKKYGDSGWISGETASVGINKADGSLEGCVFLNLNDFEKFDVKKLENISKEEITAGLTEQAKAIFGADYKDCRPTKYQLVNTNGHYYIKASGEVTFSEPECKTMMEYEYELD